MVTIIIPVYNEEKTVVAVQNNIKKLQGNYEVIFSDGFSSDNTYNLIEYKKIRETKLRSNQMNAAVKYAQGEYLWFIHADSILHKNSIYAIENSDAEAGCFKLKFDSQNIIMIITAFLSTLRVKIRKIIFGDQGFFIRKSTFIKLGGFPSVPIMEDYKLSLHLKKENINVKVLNLPIITSARRFKKNGIIKTVIKMQILQHQFRKGKNIYDIYNSYENIRTGEK
ncbi:TIGR04283 family arsenosugar biosynthesis glycosyltransferase [Treponema pedis]|uniref:Glycosyl transferase n=1 Tax=Treponema pedis str. T A4 TaxID=1291379 RepID=S5ZNQ7_9SPIR|nr:TIGR04283 family arsenosugar biosynthesis glycosyltransferase [Treponema pedis]AGT44232.1 glycosyl transferase [Treponema pedis str. T A4]